ncbi:TPA: hypothetical protein DIC40_02765 [Patescibacteria group bacterium]|nr:hypothetical protein P148_SR1C00001G0184 [candidate division SR1 bacterium RAAC1_SR1_1]HCY20770.1 hypothetical protein [Candidatus Gracilibacteria bacterium]
MSNKTNKTMELINLDIKRCLIHELGTELFDCIVGLPIEVRSDTNQRTGIQVVARETKTRNLVMVSVYNPSEAAHFFAIEKTVRTETYYSQTSQESANPSEMKFAGNVSFVDSFGRVIHVSTSGLKAEEDTFVSIVILARILEVSVNDVIQNIKKEAEVENTERNIDDILPSQFFDPNHYLYALLKEYR